MIVKADKKLCPLLTVTFRQFSSSDLWLTNKLVCFAPSLNGCRQERVPKSEGGSSKRINYIGIDVRVIPIPVSLEVGPSNKVKTMQDSFLQGICPRRSCEIL